MIELRAAGTPAPHPSSASPPSRLVACPRAQPLGDDHILLPRRRNASRRRPAPPARAASRRVGREAPELGDRARHARSHTAMVPGAPGHDPADHVRRWGHLPPERRTKRVRALRATAIGALPSLGVREEQARRPVHAAAKLTASADARGVRSVRRGSPHARRLSARAGRTAAARSSAAAPLAFRAASADGPQAEAGHVVAACTPDAEPWRARPRRSAWSSP